MQKQQLKEYCDAEFENIDAVLRELFSVVQPDRSEYTTAELAAIAVFLHNCYNGMENILKRILLARQIKPADTPSWHKDLLKSAFDNNILQSDLYETLSNYLSFRHFFVHAYSFNLIWAELKPLVDNISDTITSFRRAVSASLE